MDELLQQINIYRKEIEEYNASNTQAVEAFRIKYLGSKGIVKNTMAQMKNVPSEKRKEFGQIVNEFKELVENKYNALKKSEIRNQKSEIADIDLSLPGDPIAIGTRHPITLVRNRIIDIFHRLGFAVADGPEIEDDWHNFTALNMPEDHPARDMQDTFYINQNPDWLLRTHTSNVQIREMEKGKLPVRIVCPGRVYRNETVSARSHCFFSPG